VPAGVINVVTGYGDPCGSTLTRHPLVARIAFTGGPATARHIVRNSAENFAVTSLELGGKSPILVCEDADVESAVNGITTAIFSASGQSCVAGSRVFLHDTVHDAVLKRLAERAASIVIGDPLDAASQMGPLATQAQLESTERVIAEAVAAGAEIVAGGTRPDRSGKGWYFRPTILACESTDNPAALHEFFAPVLTIFRFSDYEAAIRAANDSAYGLAAGVFSSNGARALRLMKRLRAGIVFINTYRAVSPMAPFGGYKASGYGREAGHESLLDYTRTKSVWYRTSESPIGDPFVMQ
jgi:acyl-CoA reductase-like NAD-dependent aldehyde dehydrogenase